MADMSYERAKKTIVYRMELKMEREDFFSGMLHGMFVVSDMDFQTLIRLEYEIETLIAKENDRRFGQPHFGH